LSPYLSLISSLITRPQAIAELAAIQSRLDASEELRLAAEADLKAANERAEAFESLVRTTETELEGTLARLETAEGIQRDAESRIQRQAEELSAARLRLSSELWDAEAQRAGAAAEAKVETEALKSQVESLGAELEEAKAEAFKACEWAEKVASEAMQLEERCHTLQVRGVHCGLCINDPGLATLM